MALGSDQGLLCTVHKCYMLGNRMPILGQQQFYTLPSPLPYAACGFNNNTLYSFPYRAGHTRQLLRQSDTVLGHTKKLVFCHIIAKYGVQTLF